MDTVHVLLMNETRDLFLYKHFIKKKVKKNKICTAAFLKYFEHQHEFSANLWGEEKTTLIQVYYKKKKNIDVSRSSNVSTWQKPLSQK